MIQWFKRNDLFSIAILLLYTILLRLYSLIHPERYQLDEQASFVNLWLFRDILSAPLAQSIAAIILVYIQAVLLNVIINQNRIMAIPASAPGFLYVILSGFLPEFQGLSPELVGMTFVIVATSNLFSVYKTISVAGEIFNSAFFLSLASLFYLPYAIFILALFIEVSILRRVGMRERLQLLFGFLAIYWIAGAILFYLQRQELLPFYTFDIPGSFPALIKAKWQDWAILGVAGLFILFALSNYYNYMKKKAIEARKKIDFYYWLLLTTLLAVFFFKDLDEGHLLLLSLPLALFFAMSMIRTTNTARAELVHIILVLSLYYLHFGTDLNLY